MYCKKNTTSCWGRNSQPLKNGSKKKGYPIITLMVMFRKIARKWNTLRTKWWHWKMLTESYVSKFSHISILNGLRFTLNQSHNQLYHHSLSIANQFQAARYTPVFLGFMMYPSLVLLPIDPVIAIVNTIRLYRLYKGTTQIAVSVLTITRSEIYSRSVGWAYRNEFVSLNKKTLG